LLPEAKKGDSERSRIRLSKFRGVDRIKGVSEEVDEVREEWDREFEERTQSGPPTTAEKGRSDRPAKAE